MLMGILGAAGAWWDASVDVRGRACMASGFGCVHAPSLVAMEAVGVRRRVSLASGSVRVPERGRACACVYLRVRAYTEHSLVLCLKIVLMKRRIIKPRQLQG